MNNMKNLRNQRICLIASQFFYSFFTLAAHAFQGKEETEKILAEHIKAYLGKYNLIVPNESGSKTSWVSEIFIHPDWNSSAITFDADVAVIVLGEIIEFNAYIQPGELSFR